MVAGKELLGYRSHEMNLSPESVVYARERGSFRGQEEIGGPHR